MRTVPPVEAALPLLWVVMGALFAHAASSAAHAKIMDMLPMREIVMCCRSDAGVGCLREGASRATLFASDYRVSFWVARTTMRGRSGEEMTSTALFRRADAESFFCAILDGEPVRRRLSTRMIASCSGPSPCCGQYPLREVQQSFRRGRALDSRAPYPACARARVDVHDDLAQRGDRREGAGRRLQPAGERRRRIVPVVLREGDVR